MFAPFFGTENCLTTLFTFVTVVVVGFLLFCCASQNVYCHFGSVRLVLASSCLSWPTQAEPGQAKRLRLICVYFYLFSALATVRAKSAFNWKQLFASFMAINSLGFFCFLLFLLPLIICVLCLIAGSWRRCFRLAALRPSAWVDWTLHFAWDEMQSANWLRIKLSKQIFPTRSSLQTVFD